MSAIKPKINTDVGADQQLSETFRLLHTLLDDNADEQAETFAYLQQAIDEDRYSQRKRFKVNDCNA